MLKKDRTSLTSLRILLHQIAHVLSNRSESRTTSVNDDEEEDIATLSRSFLQLSPQELGIGARGDVISSPATSRTTDLGNYQCRGIPSPAIELPPYQQQLRAALADPVDANAASIWPETIPFHMAPYPPNSTTSTSS